MIGTCISLNRDSELLGEQASIAERAVSSGDDAAAIVERLLLLLLPLLAVNCHYATINRARSCIADARTAALH